MIWDSLIAWYLFLAGMSAGSFAATVYIGRKHPSAGKVCVAGRIVALLSLGVGLLLLMVDASAGIADPMRFFLLFSNPVSIMTVGVYIICLYLAVLVASLVFDLVKRAQPRLLALIGCMLSLCLAAYTGFLLGAATPYPLWNNAALPILFAVSGASTGLAAVLLVGRIIDGDQIARMGEVGRFGIALPLVEVFILFCMLSIIGLSSYEGNTSVSALVSGPYALAFWGGVVGLGLVVPLVIELFQKKQKTHNATWGYVSNAGVLVGGFCLRYVVVMAAVAILYI